MFAPIVLYSIQSCPKLYIYVLYSSWRNYNLVDASFYYLGVPTRNYKELHRYDNASSTYLNIVIGAVIGVAISWWIYDRQKRISIQQDRILQLISELERKNTHVLMRLEKFAEHHDDQLNLVILLNENILKLEEKIQSLIENDQ